MIETFLWSEADDIDGIRAIIKSVLAYTYKDENLEKLTTQAIESCKSVGDSGVVIVRRNDKDAIVGVLSAQLSFDWTASYLMLREQFLYVPTEYRNTTTPLRLIRRFEEVAKEMGCRYTEMGCNNHNDMKRYSLFLERCGYTHYNITHIKEVSWGQED